MQRLLGLRMALETISKSSPDTITSRRTTTEINRHAIVHRSPDQRTTETRWKQWTRAEGADSLALFVAKDDQGGDLQVSKTVYILCQNPNIPVSGRLSYFYQKICRNYRRSVGLVGDRTGLQTRIPHKTAPDRSATNFGFNFKSRYSTWRSKRFVKQKRYRAGNNEHSGRFLQYIFSSPQKVGQNATSHKLASIKQISSQDPLQNGHVTESAKLSRTTRLGNISRFKRCISAHTDSQITSEIPSVLHSRSVLSVEIPVFRPYSGGTGIHKSVSCRGSLFTSTRH